VISRFATAASLCVALAVTSAGCPRSSLPIVARPYALPSAEELLASLRKREQQMHALDATAKADERAPHTPSATVKVQIFAERPDRLRLELQAPLGGGAATLVTNGEDFALFDARQGRYYRGPAAPCNVARLIQVELPPRAIVDALLGSVPLDGSAIAVGWDPHGGREQLDLRADDGSVTRIWLDSRDRVWDPVRAERRDAHGVLVWRIDHMEFADHDGVRLPARTNVEDPAHHATVHLRYREQSVNPTFPEAGFTLAPPDGLPIEQVDCR
jgi:outer membrane lipoprotein-sorting protein